MKKIVSLLLLAAMMILTLASCGSAGFDYKANASKYVIKLADYENTKLTATIAQLASIITVSDDDDIMLITNEGTIIRTSVSGINLYSRTATGVIVMRLSDGCIINNVARLEKQEEIEKSSEEIDREIESTPAPEASEAKELPEEE